MLASMTIMAPPMAANAPAPGEKPRRQYPSKSLQEHPGREGRSQRHRKPIKDVPNSFGDSHKSSSLIRQFIQPRLFPIRLAPTSVMFRVRPLRISFYGALPGMAADGRAANGEKRVPAGPAAQCAYEGDEGARGESASRRMNCHPARSSWGARVMAGRVKDTDDG